MDTVACRGKFWIYLVKTSAKRMYVKVLSVSVCQGKRDRVNGQCYAKGIVCDCIMGSCSNICAFLLKTEVFYLDFLSKFSFISFWHQLLLLAHPLTIQKKKNH